MCSFKLIGGGSTIIVSGKIRISFVSYDSAFEIYFKGIYIGTNKDRFEAYCIRRSTENYYEMLIYLFALQIFWK